MTSFDATLRIDGLAGGRGGFALFSDIDMALAPGEALRVTGPNGTGKSTFLRCVAGLVRPDAGSVQVAMGGSAADRADTMHYLGHLNAMKPQLTVAENLAFWSKFDDGGDWRTALEAVGLPQLAELPFAFLSAGQKRRVAIARLLVTPRPIWLIDEPTAGLDAASTERFEALLDAHLGAGGIVLGATHTPLGRAHWRDLRIGANQGEAA